MIWFVLKVFNLILVLIFDPKYTCGLQDRELGSTSSQYVKFDKSESAQNNSKRDIFCHV